MKNSITTTEFICIFTEIFSVIGVFDKKNNQLEKERRKTTTLKLFWDKKLINLYNARYGFETYRSRVEFLDNHFFFYPRE